MRNKAATSFCLLLVALNLHGCAPAHQGAGAYSAASDPGQRTNQLRYVNVGALNLRSCPGVQCRIIRVLKQGEKGVVVRESAGWAEIIIDGRNGVSGWVAGQYLSEQPVAKQRPARKTGQQAVQTPALPAEEFAAPAAEPPMPEEGLASPEPGTNSGQLQTPQEEFAK